MVAIKRLAGATAVRMSWRNGSGQARTLAGTLARARLVLGLGLVCLWPVVAGAQPPPAAEKIDTRRYGIALNTRLYPQDNPKAALQSLLTALEKKQYAYAVAHLLDPDVVDKRINERMVLYLAQAEKDLQQQRQREQQQLIPPSQRLSSDPKRWKALVEQTAREYAFRELVQQVQQRLEEEPHTVRTLARILVAGTFTDSGDTAQAAHPQVTDGIVYFRRIEQRWFVDNRRGEPPAASRPTSEPKAVDPPDKR